MIEIKTDKELIRCRHYAITGLLPKNEIKFLENLQKIQGKKKIETDIIKYNEQYMLCHLKGYWKINSRGDNPCWI